MSYSLHRSAERPIRRAAELLRADGLRVWFDEWVLKPGDSIPAKIEEGLESLPGRGARQEVPREWSPSY